MEFMANHDAPPIFIPAPRRDDPTGTERNTGPGESVQAPSGYIITGQVMLTGAIIVSVLLLLFFVVYRCLQHHHRRRQLADWRRPRLIFSYRAEPSPCRLEKNVIDTIPVVGFSLHGDDSTESCAVCISEFMEGEKVRVLPQCHHRFHLECIDMWFDSHSTCPLCRADVKSPAKSDTVKLEGPEKKVRTIYIESDGAGLVEEGVHLPDRNSYYSDGRVHQSPMHMV